VATVVGELALHNGEDAPASSHEALVQAVAGAGYDQNCDGRYNAADDVRPFISGSGDAYGGIVAGSHDAAVPGSGSAGGMGFREGALPILILATDGEMRDPEAGWASPGGCPSDASFYHVYTSIAEIGAKFIGVAAHGSATVRTQLANLAIVTDSYADLDGDLVTEPTVVEWSGSNPELRELVVNAVVSLVDGAWFGRVALEPQDPLGLIVYVRPRAHVGVAAGDPLDFEVKVRGTVVPEATAASEAVELRLLADDGVVVGNRTLFIEP
jgi:hypothetical protein